MNWRETAKRNLFVHCFSRDLPRDAARVGGALKTYETVTLAPGTWFARTSAGINRVLSDLRAALGSDSAARVLIVDATEDQWASWPTRDESWPELDDLKVRYGWSQVDAHGRRMTFERLTPVLASKPASARRSRGAHPRD